jgi:hypothetical protein
LTDYNIPRDRYDRPSLFPPDSARRIGYSRPSTLGKDLDTGKGLIPWEQTMVVTGLYNRPELWAKANGVFQRGGSWGTDKEFFKRLMDECKDAGNWKAKADRGTALHDLTDAADKGILDHDRVPESLQGAVFWYEKHIAPKINVLAAEAFVAVDRLVELPGRKPISLRAAGSVDRIAEFDGERYIVDVKSGRDDEFRTGVCGQLWLYSVGDLYADPLVTQDQEPQFEWVDSWRSADINPKTNDPVNPSWRADTGVNQEWAIMLQAPKFAVRGEWRWRCHWIPLDTGREIVECGQWARRCRNVKEFKEFDL